MSTRTTGRYKILMAVLLVILLIFSIGLILTRNANAQDIPTDTPDRETVVPEKDNIEVISPYFSIEHLTLPDGTELSGYIINGPPTPPPGTEAERAASIKPISIDGVLPDFPSYSWVFGCSAVSGAMISAYYDRNGYSNMYVGPTNGGVMPLTDTSWPTWNDGYVTYPNNPLIASHNGVDGRVTKGSIDDYWIQYGSGANDPYITGSWAEHTWGSAIGDYMKTSQSAHGNTDGSTTFYNFSSSAKLNCSEMVGYGIDDEDGTYGRKLFYEAKGYTVTDCYNQNTDNNTPGGFSLANFQAEINSGHPVLLNLVGHSIVGYGYSGSTIYIRDTWDPNPANTYTMPWGGSYSDMELYSVSVVHLGNLTGPAEMDVRGNSLSIVDGDSTPSLSDNTDFGSTALDGGTVSRTYTIYNLGGTNLNLTGVPKVSVSGSHAADFSVTLQPSSPVAPGGSTTFTVVFNPSALGIRTAALSIANDDPDENPYNFAIQGTGVENITQLIYLPLVLKLSGSSGWETLVNTTFEGDFPGSWDVDDDYSGYGEYYWAARPCRPFAGSNSGWAVGGGANGNTLSCGSNYPYYADSWMVYGPFSLVGATAARLDFKLWLSSEYNYDGIFFGASINGTNFYGSGNTGNSAGWIDRTLDLSSVYSLGDLRGQPQVWVAIVFSSDSIINYAEGAYVDNIVLRRCKETTCPGLNVISPEVGGIQIIDKPWEATINR
jgi:HYDIN/CFA65/VesB-like, Ig-like domain